MDHPPSLDTATMVEDGDVKGFDFSEQSIRKGFIKKVYSILMCQLLVTLSFITLFVFCDPVKKWSMTPPQLWVLLSVAFVATLTCLIAMLCFEDIRRKTPHNVIFLGIFTIAQSFLLGVTSVFYKPETVMLAVGITAAICLALTLFAFQTKWDFTTMGGFLLCALVVMVLFGIMMTFMYNRVLNLVYASLGALLFSFYLVYDTQLMLGGHHKYSVSPEEYIFAALNLYLDVINLFLYILRIVGSR